VSTAATASTSTTSPSVRRRPSASATVTQQVGATIVTPTRLVVIGSDLLRTGQVQVSDDVNDAPPTREFSSSRSHSSLTPRSQTAHGDVNMNTMWSESASPRPSHPTTLLRGSSPAPSSSCESQSPFMPPLTMNTVHSLTPFIRPSLSALPGLPTPLWPARSPHPYGHLSTATSPLFVLYSCTTTTPALSPAASSASFIVEPNPPTVKSFLTRSP